jgi:hypothetical protein
MWPPMSDLKTLLLTAGVIAGAAYALPAIASTATDLAQCKMKAEQTYPRPTSDGYSYSELKTILRNQGNFAQTCMEAAGYHLVARCAWGYGNPEYEQAIAACRLTILQNVRTCVDSTDIYYSIHLKLEQPTCYQADSWWKRWLK